jgi:hypothetical protein
VRRLKYQSLDISEDKTSEADKKMPPRFHASMITRTTFVRTMRSSANARDAARTKPLEILSTQSITLRCM